MSLLFDFIILLICALTIYLGFRRGFIKSIMHFGSTVAAVFISVVFTPTAAGWIKDAFILDAVADGIAGTIKNIASSVSGQFNLAQLFSDKESNSFAKLLSDFGADVSSLQSTYAGYTAASEEQVNALSRTIASPVAETISTVIAFIVLFVISLLVLWIVTMILDAVFHLPVLKSANKILGLLFGIVCAALLAWLLSLLSIAVIHALTPMYPNLFSQSVINNSVLLRFFAENNPLSMMFGRLPELQAIFGI